MGRRGPPRKPTDLKLLQGQRIRNASVMEPKPTKAVGPTPPFKLSKEARRLWGKVSDFLQSQNMLSVVDVCALARYCEQFARWLTLGKWLDEHGQVFTMKDDHGRIKYVGQLPQVSIHKQIGQELTRFERDFGMTPASRASFGQAPISAKTPQELLRSKLYG